MSKPKFSHIRKKPKTKVSGKSFPDYHINEWLGLITQIKNTKEQPKGSASDSLNWLTGQEKDHIELRRGSALLGVTRITGTGQITGLGIGFRADQTQIPFFTYGQKIKYYDSVTNDNIESGSNVLPAAATSDMFSIQAYSGLAGFFVYISSPNSSAYKIATANPASVMDLAQKQFKGNFSIRENRTFLWNRKSTTTGKQQIDKTNLYLSYIDKVLYSSFTAVTSEALGTGDGTTKKFTGTLAGAASTVSVFNLIITAGTEIAYDDANGNLASSAGGTGTINYVTGAWAFNFNAAPANSLAITGAYAEEDSTTTGIWDFSYNASTRVAATGNFFLQSDGGGNMFGIAEFNSAAYCLHQYRTWVLTSTQTDTGATNLPFRSQLGVPGPLAFDEAADGIPFLDLNIKNHPRIGRLELDLSASGSATVVPKTLSPQLDLSLYGYDNPVVKQWGDYIVMSCQTIDNNAKNNAFNNRMFVMNRNSGQWDLMDCLVNNLAIYNGTLLAGDPISNNVYQLFTGFDDDTAILNNFWTSGEMDMGFEGRKRFYRFVVDGLISIKQNIKFYISYDNSPFVLLATILGNGTYVDFNSPQTIGSTMIGSKAIGDGTPSGGAINAYHYREEFIIASQIFEYAKLKIVAGDIGWAQVNTAIFKDLRYKGRRVSSQYAPAAE